MKRTFLTIATVVFLSPLATSQDWVTSFGVSTRYRPPLYVSGYGVSDLSNPSERLQAARAAALSQLSQQIRVQVTSDESIRTSDYGNGQRSRYVNTVQTASDLHISGAAFEIARRGATTHALAWISIADLRSQFEDRIRDASNEISTLSRRFDASVTRADLEQAEQELAAIDTAFAALTDAATVIRALDALARRPAGVQHLPADPVAIHKKRLNSAFECFWRP